MSKSNLKTKKKKKKKKFMGKTKKIEKIHQIKYRKSERLLPCWPLVLKYYHLQHLQLEETPPQLPPEKLKQLFELLFPNPTPSIQELSNSTTSYTQNKHFSKLLSKINLQQQPVFWQKTKKELTQWRHKIQR